MGNHRFKLSDMMPNAWFYKLRDMSKLRSHKHKNPPPSAAAAPRKSFHYYAPSDHPPKLYHPPTKPLSKKRPKRKTIYMPSPRKVAPSYPVYIQDYVDTPPDFSESAPTFENSDSFDGGMSPFSCKLSSSPTDIIINVDETSYAVANIDRLDHLDVISDPDLPPIQTKPAACSDMSIEFAAEKPKRKKRNSASPGRRRSFSGGVRIRGGGRRRRSVKEEEKKGMFYTESFAIVKASVDPERDFRESMMEMIVENNMRTSKDLEELLACYLSLNSNQYHDLIIKAFEQIWFSMPPLHF